MERVYSGRLPAVQVFGQTNFWNFHAAVPVSPLRLYRVVVGPHILFRFFLDKLMDRFFATHRAAARSEFDVLRYEPDSTSPALLSFIPRRLAQQIISLTIYSSLTQ